MDNTFERYVVHKWQSGEENHGLAKNDQTEGFEDDADQSRPVEERSSQRYREDEQVLDEDCDEEYGE